MWSVKHLTFPLALLMAAVCEGNTEKSIFLAPATVNIPAHQPTLEVLGLDVLTPTRTSIRSHLNASFPNAGSAVGLATWFLLDDLRPSQRYELRVCWAATQPTNFILDVYPLEEVWETPDLITSLASYVESRASLGTTQPMDASSTATGGKAHGRGRTTSDSEASAMLLRVLAAADYYSHDAAVMTHVDPVLVDITLDPYLLNVVPQSLAPTVVYITLVAGLAWALAQRIRNHLLVLTSSPGQALKKDM
ncbi:hypothetical protein HYQ45_016933 [Verticillium longisporum]|uniref:GPI transamidase component PIG-T n=1 Tax=Verticillium longisporum TaxID=100787 RepID=A0A8I2Z438_VERLO|nr:hypothetical protein VdG1_02005 [Verticillium dahliae VDG1]KAG7113207.1 hypothetical protein HYQ45_016933 [Verticillium longisporum]RBQ88876.1 hypothetical protein VDGD_04059 [Verticillium dahliae]